MITTTWHHNENHQQAKRYCFDVHFLLLFLCVLFLARPHKDERMKFWYLKILKIDILKFLLPFLFLLLLCLQVPPFSLFLFLSLSLQLASCAFLCAFPQEREEEEQGVFCSLLLPFHPYACRYMLTLALSAWFSFPFSSSYFYAFMYTLPPFLASVCDLLLIFQFSSILSLAIHLSVVACQYHVIILCLLISCLVLPAPLAPPLLLLLPTPQILPKPPNPLFHLAQEHLIIPIHPQSKLSLQRHILYPTFIHTLATLFHFLYCIILSTHQQVLVTLFLLSLCFLLIRLLMCCESFFPLFVPLSFSLYFTLANLTI